MSYLINYFVFMGNESCVTNKGNINLRKAKRKRSPSRLGDFKIDSEGKDLQQLKYKNLSSIFLKVNL